MPKQAANPGLFPCAMHSNVVPQNAFTFLSVNKSVLETTPLSSPPPLPWLGVLHLSLGERAMKPPTRKVKGHLLYYRIDVTRIASPCINITQDMATQNCECGGGPLKQQSFRAAPTSAARAPSSKTGTCTSPVRPRPSVPWCPGAGARKGSRSKG